jgi:transcription initiation factor TFIID subunit 2
MWCVYPHLISNLLIFLIEIECVTVASHKAEFLYHDPLTSLTPGNGKDCHSYPEMKRKLFSALTECEDGELAIGIPGQVSLKQASLCHL